MMEGDCDCGGREGMREWYELDCYSEDIQSERAEGFINSSWNTQLSCHLSSVSSSAVGIFPSANAASDLMLTIPRCMQL